MHEPHRPKLQSLTLAVAIAFAVFAVPPCGAATADAQPASAPGALLGTSVARTSARIVSIDQASSSITLSGARGTHVTVHVDPDVADVSQLKPGDDVDIVYRHAMLLRADRLSPGGLRSRVETTSTVPAAGGVTTTTHSVEVVAAIRAIDHAHRRLTLRWPQETVVVDVPPNVSIEDLKVGDRVRADYVMETAIKVTRNGASLH